MARESEWMGILLNQHKLAASMLTSGILESSNEQVRSHFKSLLDGTLQHQKEIYNAMNQKGWYQVQPAPQDEVNRIRQSMSSMQRQMQ
ncbi:MAG: spore coat protein [Syntrophomonadaceae bacterium]|nr:spore coat protein [Syntrophomonadaceae bacterium]